MNGQQIVIVKRGRQEIIKSVQTYIVQAITMPPKRKYIDQMGQKAKRLKCQRASEMARKTANRQNADRAHTSAAREKETKRRPKRAPTCR